MIKTINVFNILRKNISALCGFEFIFRISAALFFIPAIAKVANIIINKAGIMYITSKNISGFLKNPLTFILIFAIVLLVISLSLFEYCCLSVCFECSLLNKKINITNIFLSGYSRMKESLRKNRFKPVLKILLLFPLFNFHVTAVMCDKIDILETLIKFSAKKIPIKNPIIIFVAVTVTAAAFVMCRSSVAADSSAKIKKPCLLKRIIMSIVTIIITIIMVGALIMLIYFLLILLATLILRFFGDSSLALARLIRFENDIFYFIAFLTSIAGVVFSSAMVFTFRQKNCLDNQIPVIPENAKKTKNIIKKICVTVFCSVLFIFDIVTIISYVSNGSHFLEEMLISTTVTAHRGAAAFAPENTMDAVRYSIKSGADYIEIDVQLTADGEVILLHDENLKRTTGYNGFAEKMNYSDILKLDAGSYFGAEFFGAYVPTLEEVLNECKGKININIELKKNSGSDYELVDKVLELIHKYEMQEQCVITSTAYSYLRYVKNNAPELRTGFIANMLFGDAASLEYADFFSVKYVVVTDNFVKTAHAAGKDVHVWTVNTKLLMNRMKGLDVDSIITDNPVLCKKILTRKNDRKSFAELLQTILHR